MPLIIGGAFFIGGFDRLHGWHGLSGQSVGKIEALAGLAGFPRSERLRV